MFTKRKSGFTMIEMVVVVMVVGLLALVGINGMSGVQSRYAVRAAKNVFGSLHARTRAQAIEFGQNMKLEVSTAGDSVWITRNDSVIDIVRFGADSTGSAVRQGVDITAADASYTVCMGPRGFAETTCTSFAGRKWIYFSQGGETDSLGINSMGTILY